MPGTGGARDGAETVSALSEIADNGAQGDETSVAHSATNHVSLMYFRSMRLVNMGMGSV